MNRVDFNHKSDEYSEDEQSVCYAGINRMR